MKKWIIIIILMLATVQLVSGATVLQVSKDNSTWTNIESHPYYGTVSGNRGRATYLTKDTTYYFRVMDDTHDWTYLEQTTDQGGLDEMELAMVISLGIVAFFFLYFSFKLDENHFLLKLLLMFGALILVMIMPNALISGETGSTNVTFLKITTWIFRAFVTYFFLYIFWHWAQKSEKFCRMLGAIGVKSNKKENEQE